MNKTLSALLCQSLFLCLYLSNTYYSNAQGVLDIISQDDLCVSSVLIGTEKSKLLSRYGKPDSVVINVNEFEGTEFEEFIYYESSFYFQDDIFISFNLRDDNFQFDYGQIKVGNSIEEIEQVFPNSYNRKEIEETKTTIRVRIGETDSYLLFICSNGKIKRIMTWDDQ